jgi:hypothetical protein
MHFPNVEWSKTSWVKAGRVWYPNKHFVAKSIVFEIATAILGSCVAVDERLMPFMDSVEIVYNGYREEHVSSENKCTGRDTKGVMYCRTGCVVRRRCET